MKNEVRKKTDEIKKYKLLDLILQTSLEISSLGDFISDSVILYALYKSGHTFWFSLTFFTMVCPYYTSYTTIMSFQILSIKEKLKNENTINLARYLLFLVTITPLMI